jgi:hypothetical protein
MSVAMTAVAIWTTALLGTRLFDRRTGLLAATLFGLSPYVLHFGRDALTQGDAFTVPLVALAVLAFDRFDHDRTTRSLFVLSLVIGLAMATKFTLVVLVPGFVLHQCIGLVAKRVAIGTGDDLERPARVPRGFALLAIMTGLLASAAAVISTARQSETGGAAPELSLAAVAMWIAACVGLLVCGVAALRTTPSRNNAASATGVRWPRLGAWIAIVPLATATMLAPFPEHIFNVEIISSLIDRLTTRDGGVPFLPTAVASAKLYFGLILFKLGLPFGILTCVALVWMLVRSRAVNSFRLCAATLCTYGAMLLVMPLQQPFWLVSVYPLIVLVLSAAIFEGLVATRPRTARIGIAGVTAVAMLWLGIGIARVVPTFGYYGYEIVGNRWLGANSRGYRALVTVTNDGSTETMDWLRGNAPAGSLVVSYLDDVFLLKRLGEIKPFPFRLKQAIQYPTPKELAADVGRADFVVLRAVGDGRRPSNLAAIPFANRFDPKPIHEVIRGRGPYRTVIARTFRSKASAGLVGSD